MQQLTGIDATFLNIESATTYGHVSSVAVFEASEVPGGGTFEQLRQLISQRIHLLAPYRRRLVEVPFGLDQPYWIEDPDFDLDFHLRHIGLPAPGNETQLAAQVERIVARPLDRSRPLWEYYMVEGLADGRVAHLNKFHHCAIDGISGAEILTNLLDPDITPRVIEQPDQPWIPEAQPSDFEMLGRGLVSVATKPAKGIRLLRDGVRNVSAVARSLGLPELKPQLRKVRQGDFDRSMLSMAPTLPPRVSFNAAIGPHRRFAYTSIPLDRVKAIKTSFGVTLNDVVMTLCSETLRRYLLERDELPEKSLVAMVPVSVRTKEQLGDGGNQIASMTASLHTDIEDLGARVGAVHDTMKVAKEAHLAIPATLLQDFAQFSPPAVAARAARTIARAAARSWVDLPYNVVISNVPGPQFPLYTAGCRLAACYPVSTIHDGVGLNMTLQSYNGALDFGLIGCRDLVPDIWDLISHLEAAADDLYALIETPPG